VFKEDGVCVVEVRVRVKNKTVSASSASYESIEDPSRPVAMNYSRNGSAMAVSVGSSIDYQQIVSHLEMTYPKSGKITVSVASSQRKICRVSRGGVNVLKQGSCTVTVKVSVRGRTRFSGAVVLQTP
jgi:hypothetical protein